MTRQEIFNKVWERAKDRRRSFRRDPDSGMDMCLYRDKRKKLACFAGCLFPDAEYHPDMEKSSFEDIVDEFTTLKRFRKNAGFVRELQLIHDCADPAEWDRELRTFAMENRLKVPK